MDFKSPYFLLALLCLVIPVIIHLFNLRKYKKVYFPSLRLLDEMLVKNKRMSKIQKWLLFSCRFLAVLFLVLAFAHPYLSGKNAHSEDRAKVLFIDNSMSSTYMSGQKMLLEDLKSTAVNWIEKEGINNLYILTQDAMYNYAQFNKQDAINYIKNIQPSAFAQSIQAVINSIEQIKKDQNNAISLFVLSDHQQGFYSGDKYEPNESIFVYNLFSDEITSRENVYIDTAYFTQIPMSDEEGVDVITEIKHNGLENDTEIQLNYQLNGQQFASKTISISNKDSIIYDTTTVHLKSAVDNNIAISFQSKTLSFDDNYYLTTRLSKSVKVAIINDGPTSPYLSQAFNSTRKIFPEQYGSLDAITDIETYSLIFYNNIRSLSEQEIIKIKNLLSKGGSVAITFDTEASIENLKKSISSIADITINEYDTSIQAVADIEINHPLIKDVIANKPENIQLPIVKIRYKYNAQISARPQDLMRMRDGSGYITQFNIEKGALYLIGSPISPESGNLAQSYYFAPILFKMATNGRNTDIQSYEIISGHNINLQNSLDENTVLSLTKNEKSIIPVQKKEGNHVILNIPTSITGDSVYNIQDQQQRLIGQISLNYDRSESITKYLNTEILENTFGIKTLSGYQFDSENNLRKESLLNDLWKWVITLVLILIILESYFLLKKN